jgi:hypothetical protein
MKTKPTLTPTMTDCWVYMGKAPENSLVRHQGGFWTSIDGRHPVFGTSTIEALVKRGVAEYTEWKDGRIAPFPIRVKRKEIE